MKTYLISIINCDDDEVYNFICEANNVNECQDKMRSNAELINSYDDNLEDIIQNHTVIDDLSYISRI